MTSAPNQSRVPLGTFKLDMSKSICRRKEEDVKLRGRDKCLACRSVECKSWWVLWKVLSIEGGPKCRREGGVRREEEGEISRLSSLDYFLESLGCGAYKAWVNNRLGSFSAGTVTWYYQPRATDLNIKQLRVKEYLIVGSN